VRIYTPGREREVADLHGADIEHDAIEVEAGLLLPNRRPD
jgi:hypothetical protein